MIFVFPWLQILPLHGTSVSVRLRRLGCHPICSASRSETSRWSTSQATLRFPWPFMLPEGRPEAVRALTARHDEVRICAVAWFLASCFWGNHWKLSSHKRAFVCFLCNCSHVMCCISLHDCFLNRELDVDMLFDIVWCVLLASQVRNCDLCRRRWASLLWRLPRTALPFSKSFLTRSFHCRN